LVDPGAEEGDLGGGPLGAFFGHDGVGFEASDEADDERFVGLTGDGGGAGVAAFEEGFAGFEGEAAFVFAFGVAVNAGGFEEGFDFLGEVDLVGGGRGEGFGGGSAGGGDGEEEGQNDQRE
jgi:hypothetical protein